MNCFCTFGWPAGAGRRHGCPALIYLSSDRSIEHLGCLGALQRRLGEGAAHVAPAPGHGPAHAQLMAQLMAQLGLEARFGRGLGRARFGLGLGLGPGSAPRWVKVKG